MEQKKKLMEKHLNIRTNTRKEVYITKEQEIVHEVRNIESEK